LVVSHLVKLIVISIFTVVEALSLDSDTTLGSILITLLIGDHLLLIRVAIHALLSDLLKNLLDVPLDLLAKGGLDLLIEAVLEAEAASQLLRLILFAPHDDDALCWHVVA
jgi:hypothetical protein